MDASKLDKVLLDFTNKRKAQKDKFLGELFPAALPAAPGSAFITFFQTDEYTGNAKGIVRIRL